MEALTGGTVQQHLPHGAVDLGRRLGKLRQDGLLGWLQQAVQASENNEGWNDLPVVGRLVVAPQQVCDRPDKVTFSEWPSTCASSFCGILDAGT